MAVRKLAVSLEESLADAVTNAAEKDTDGNVSAWLAEAARERLRLQAARQALEAFEAEDGPITAEEREWARKQWPAEG